MRSVMIVPFDECFESLLLLQGVSEAIKRIAALRRIATPEQLGIDAEASHAA